MPRRLRLAVDAMQKRILNRGGHVMEFDMKEHITARMERLRGAWVLKRENYDEELGHALEWKVVKRGRYADLESNDGKLIEAKKTKGGNIIVKLPQLAEILRGPNLDSQRTDFTLVLKTHKNR